MEEVGGSGAAVSGSPNAFHRQSNYCKEGKRSGSAARGCGGVTTCFLRCQRPTLLNSTASRGPIRCFGKTRETQIYKTFLYFFPLHVLLLPEAPVKVKPLIGFRLWLGNSSHSKIKPETVVYSPPFSPPVVSQVHKGGGANPTKPQSMMWGHCMTRG